MKYIAIVVALLGNNFCQVSDLYDQRGSIKRCAREMKTSFLNVTKLTVEDCSTDIRDTFVSLD